MPGCRAALYWHFTSKTDIFHAMFVRQHDANKVVCAAARDPDEPDPLGQMRSILSHFLRKVVEDPQQRRVCEILHHKCELAGEQAALRQHLQATGEEIDQDIALSLRHAIQRGQLPANLDLQRAAVAVHAYIHGLINNWLLRPDGYPRPARPSPWSTPCWTCSGSARRCATRPEAPRPAAPRAAVVAPAHLPQTVRQRHHHCERSENQDVRAEQAAAPAIGSASQAIGTRR